MEAEPGILLRKPAASYAAITLTQTSSDPRIRHTYSLLGAFMFKRDFNLQCVPSKDHDSVEEEPLSQSGSLEELEGPQAQTSHQEQVEPMDDAIQLHLGEEDEGEADLDPYAEVKDWTKPYD